MKTENKNTSPTADREIVISREINAPQSLVFEAWTKPEHLINWWGPNGFTNTFDEIEVKPGGRWKFTMHGPDGVDYPNVIVYREVNFPERLAYSHGDGSGKHGFETTVTFEKLEEKKTRVTMTVLFPTREALEYVVREHGAAEGGKQTIGKLAAYVESLK